jgi:HEAT repeat protein
VARTEPDDDLKQEAVEAVAEADGEDAVYPLMHFYRREANGKLKTDVINALARIGSAGPLDLLVDALQDSNANVRSCAALALGEIGRTEAETPLRSLLGDPVELVRKSAAKALGMIRFLPRSA